MSKLNEININIKKAVLTQISIELKDEGKVDVTLRGSLMTAEGKPVSDFWFNNATYISEGKQIEVPVDVHMLIGDLFKKFTPVIYQKLNDSYKQLPAKTEKKSPVIAGVDFAGTTPDDIPF